jgi:hypothetical protein
LYQFDWKMTLTGYPQSDGCIKDTGSVQVNRDLTILLFAPCQPLRRCLFFCRANLDVREQFDDPHHRRMIEVSPPLRLHRAE